MPAMGLALAGLERRFLAHQESRSLPERTLRHCPETDRMIVTTTHSPASSARRSTSR